MHGWDGMAAAINGNLEISTAVRRVVAQRLGAGCKIVAAEDFVK